MTRRTGAMSAAARFQRLPRWAQAREVFDHFVKARGELKTIWANDAMRYADVLSEKQIAWAAKFATVEVAA